MDKELLSSIEKFVLDNRSAMYRDIARLVAIESVEGESTPEAPFGPGPAKALEEGLKIAGELGLATRNCEGRMGYASVGSGDKYIATVTHLDCVPTGDGWSADPFVMREREGYIIGRGVMDDKGPSVLCLYALKYLREKNVPLRYEVRALLGTAEETGMEDVEYYLKNYPAPVFCFSPDADFPLINGEKGITAGKIASVCGLENIIDISGGFAVNAVPDKAEAWVRATGLESSGSVDAQESGGVTHLTAHGVGGHASAPQGTVNAIYELIKYILSHGIAGEGEEKYLRAVSLLHEGFDGSALGVQADDGLFKPLTIVGGTIGVEDGHIVQTYDSRYPTNTDGAKIAEGIQKAAGDAARVELMRDVPPFYMSLDNPAVQLCVQCYNAVTGENAQPFTIGGGTYARDFPNAVSFGPEHPERPQPDFAGPIHGVDEAACMEYLEEALRVYILALIELQKLDF